MIDLYYPNTDSNLWFTGPDGGFYGPFALTGEYSLKALRFDAFGNTFDWSKGIRGENDVTHNRITGQIVYNPSAETFVANPTCTYSNRCMTGSATKMTGSSVNLELHQGFNPSGLAKTRSFYLQSPIWDYLDEWWYWVTDLAQGYVRTYNLLIYRDNYKRIYKWNQHYMFDIVYDVNRKQFSYKHSFGTLSTSSSFRRSAALVIDADTMQNLPSVLDPRFVGMGGLGVPTTKVAIAYRINGMQLSPKEAVGIVKDEFLKGLPLEIEDEPHIYQSLVARAVNQVDYRRLNIYEFLQGFSRPTQLIPKLLNLKNLKKAEAIAGDYLTYIYGILPTINDLEEIWNYFKGRKNYYDRNGYIVFNSKQSKDTSVAPYSCETVWRAKVAIDEEDPRWIDLRKQYDNLARFPTVKEIWELIPYTFVIDWFVNISSMLSSLQAEGYKLRLPIRYYTFSKKSVVQRSNSLHNGALTYNLTRTNYHRWVTDHCPSVFLPPEFETTFLDRWIEGAALIIARKR